MKAEQEGGEESSPDFEGDEAPQEEPAKAEPATVKQESGDAAGSTSGGPGSMDAGVKDPPGQASMGVTEGDKSGKPWVPDRIQKALKKSNTFDEYRKNRDFRYLHLFSGEKINLENQFERRPKQQGWRSMWKHWTARRTPTST